MKIYFFGYSPKTIFITFSILLISCKVNFINAQENYLREMQIDNSTKLEENNQALPTNPFELVEMIRRANSLNDATKPSDALDDALKSFNMMEENENL